MSNAKAIAINKALIIRKHLMVSFLGLMVILALMVNAARAADGPESVADLAEKLLPAVVNISTAQKVKTSDQRRIPTPRAPEGSPFQEFFDEFFEKRGNGDEKNDEEQGRGSRQVRALGSGFIIAAEGIIITNNHVIEGADEITVNLADGTALPAQLIGRDEKTDLAVLKVEADEPLPFVPMGSSSDMRVGDWVMAIGNPFGLGGTVTVGIVSAQNRNINSGPYDNFIQTDASINRGNSGGPLFNDAGEVVGINTAIFSPSGGSIGIGFAVPSDLAKTVIAQLQEFGETRRGWLGVRIQQVTDEIAESLGMDEARGALVAGITEGGPAEAAGLEPGDIILTFDGKEVGEMRELPRIVADTQVGKGVEVTVLRNDEEIEISVTLGRLEDGEKLVADTGEESNEPDAKAPKLLEMLGMILLPLDETTREEFDISAEIETGVVIAKVDPNSNAGEKQVRKGEVIQEISQTSVNSLEEVSARIEELTEDGRRSVLLLINRAGELRFVAVRLKQKDK